jgi:hypothetical protein
MSDQIPVRIFSHWSKSNGTWKSNYELEKFWSANKRLYWTTSQFVGKLKIIASQHVSQYQIIVEDYNEHDSGYYLIFYGSSMSILEHHGLAFVTTDMVEKCNQGQLKLLIAFVHETFDTKISTKEWFGNFCSKLSLIGITRPHSVVILTATKSTVDLDFDHRCQFVYYPWFEADLQASLKFDHRLPPVIDFDNKHKHFINLNLAVRTHRFLMIMYLMYRNVAHMGHVSWRNVEQRSWRELLGASGYDHLDFSWRKQLDGFDRENPNFLNLLNNMGVLNSMELDQIDFAGVGPNNGMTWVGAEKFYLESWVDLISETHCELYGDVFLTEKTFKPMAYGLPFVLNGSQHSLKLLQQMGYETFPELFDEQYDSMPASMKKIAAIGNEIVAFCTQPEHLDRLKTDPVIRAKLEHNQHLFWTRNHAQCLGDLLHQAWIRGHA